jgi:AsmA protein
LLRESAPKPGAKVQGFLQRSGWSDTAIDLSAFRLVDAELKLSLGRLLFQDIKVGQTQLRVALKDRILISTFDEIQLYDGRGSGLVKIDGAAAVPVIGANFTIDGTSAAPLLKDAANFDWVAGRAKVTLAIGGQGTTEHQIVASLQGRADVQFRDGAVVGYNVTKLLQGVMQGRIPSLERNGAERTDFSEMAASFTIQNGIATNKDLRLISPVIRISGSGSASLPERTMDYTVRPKLTGTAPESASLEVPVKLTGSWDKPAITPDIDGVLKNPEAAIDTVRQIGRQIQKGDGDVVNKAKDLLNQFLKR